MKESFLAWLDKWEKQVNDRKDLDAAEKEKALISKETLQGIRITGSTIVSLTQYCMLTNFQFCFQYIHLLN